MTDTELIYPGEMPMGAVAAALLKLADHSDDVDWQPRMGAFVVPAEVARKYATMVAAEAPTPAPEKVKGARKRPTAKKATADAPRRARRGTRGKGTTTAAAEKAPEGGGPDA